MPRPNLIQVETTTACNAHCPMCPRDIQQRGHGQMETELFWSVVRQAYDMGIRTLLPFIDGEPLADPRMLDIVEQLAAQYPDLVVGWYTNGSLLTEERSRRLLKAGNIRQFNVSMQGGTKEVYEQNMGLSWEKTVRNVEQLLAINRALGGLAEVRLNMCVFSKTSDTVNAFRQRWEDLGATICLGAYSNFGGMVHDEEGERPWELTLRKPCDRALTHLYVYWNGDVGQCCFDLMGSVVYGNVHTTPLEDIWHSPAFQAMHRAHETLDVAAMPLICRNCNSSKFHG